MKAISHLTQILNFNWQNTKHTLQWNPNRLKAHSDKHCKRSAPRKIALQTCGWAWARTCRSGAWRFTREDMTTFRCSLPNCSDSNESYSYEACLYSQSFFPFPQPSKSLHVMTLILLFCGEASTTQETSISITTVEGFHVIMEGSELFENSKAEWTE